MRPLAESEKKGGRKKASIASPDLERNFSEVVCEHLAGDPMDEDVVWTCLSPAQIAQALAKKGTPLCEATVRELLSEQGLRRRQIAKTKTMGESPSRNEQFKNIARLKRQYLASADPIISMDTKKKELLGEFFRPGRRYADGPNAAFDHDFPSFAEGVLIPHGLYDLKRNEGHITLGLSHDTSQFACDSLRLWWRRHGRRRYPGARSLLLLCDGGGSNNCRHSIFKQDLQRLVDRIGLPIRVAHYPPYCSKYNPIEHRLFPHVQRAWSGIVLRSLQVATDGLRRVWTRTGLKVTHAVLDKVYALKRRASNEFMANSPIQTDSLLPEWNYTVLPTIVASGSYS
jgi:Rhodopirellula transposase DDE domain